MSCSNVWSRKIDWVENHAMMLTATTATIPTVTSSTVNFVRMCMLLIQSTAYSSKICGLSP